MDRLRDLTVFKAVVDHHSFRRAAEALRLPAAVVTRSVKELEGLLGLRLINRTTRSLSVTAAGHEVFARAQQLLTAYEGLLGVGRSSNTEVRGTVRLAAPAFFARRLGAALASFVAGYPQANVDLQLTWHGAAPGAEADLELCLEHALRPTQIARLVAILPLRACASPAYLARRGLPTTRAQLSTHDGLGWDGHRSGAHWRFIDPRTGSHVDQAIRPCLQSAHVEVLLEAAERGAGIAILPEFLVRDALAHGRLRALLPDDPLAPLALHLAYGCRQHQPLVHRRLVEHLARSLADEPAPLRAPAFPAPALA